MRIERSEIDSGIPEMETVELRGYGKVFKLMIIRLADRFVVHGAIDLIPDSTQIQGETYALYSSVATELEKLVGQGLPVDYYFLSENERMKWFAENKLRSVLGTESSLEIEDRNVLRMSWNLH